MDGWQVEKSDKWLQFGNPWEIGASTSVEVGLFEHTETYADDKGAVRHRWVPGTKVKGIPFDTPIPGYQTRTVNKKSEACGSPKLSTRWGWARSTEGIMQAPCGPRRSRDHQQSVVSAGRDGRRQAPSVDATVFLYVVLTPGHGPAAPGDGKVTHRVRQKMDCAIERHTSFDWHPRTDAPADG